MATADPEEFWREQINGLSAALPEDGLTAPDRETIPNKKPLKEGKRKVQVQKIITQVYVITDTEGKAYTALTSQKMILLGQMTLERALKIAQEDSFD